MGGGISRFAGHYRTAPLFRGHIRGRGGADVNLTRREKLELKRDQAYYDFMTNMNKAQYAMDANGNVTAQGTSSSSIWNGMFMNFASKAGNSLIGKLLG